MAHAQYDPLSLPGPIGNREGAGASGWGLRGRGVKQPFWVDLIVKVASIVCKRTLAYTRVRSRGRRGLGLDI